MSGTARTVELLILTVAAAVASWLLTGAVRRYAMARAILDIPNPRSSHSAPTPRGGGLAIAASSLTAVALCGLLGWVPHRDALGLVGGGVLVTAVGWLDDRRRAPAIVRIAAHVAAAAWVLYWLGGMPGIRILGQGWAVGWPGSLIALLGRSVAIGLEQLAEILYYVGIGQELCPVRPSRSSFGVAHRVERKKAVIAL